MPTATHREAHAERSGQASSGSHVTRPHAPGAGSHVSRRGAARAGGSSVPCSVGAPEWNKRAGRPAAGGSYWSWMHRGDTVSSRL